MRSYRLVLACAGLAANLGLSSPAFAWGDEGHEVVALIADHYLTPSAKAKVADLLSGPVLPGQPSDKAEVPSDIAHRATWADKYRDSAPDRKTATGQWHFVDIELDKPDIDAACFSYPVPSDGPFPGIPNNCVVDKIKQFRDQLADPSSTHDQKVVALEFLLHFVGDIHQPLHASDHMDKGGNDIKISYKSGSATKTSNLHSYWDTVTVSRLGSSADTVASSLLKSIPARPSSTWTDSDPASWAQGSYALAKSVTYKLPAAKSGKVTLTSAYVSKATSTARKQLQLAGFRLAMLLNTALK